MESTRRGQASEHEIQSAILDYLTARHIFHYRQNTGMAKLRGGFWVRFGKPGAPDIVAVVDGRFVGIEVKRPGQKQSKAQEEYEMELERANGIYILAWSLEDVIRVLG